MMNKLLIRSLTGSVYVILVVLTLIIHPILFISLLSLFNFQSLNELVHMQHKSGRIPFWISINSALLFISLLLRLYDFNSSFQLVPVLLIPIYLYIASLYTPAGSNRQFLTESVFASIYISLPLLLVGLLHLESTQISIPIILLVFILIWINDTFAYLSGISLGKHKLFERISPKKSWEGFFGGLVMTMLASYILSKHYPEIKLIEWLVLGSLVAVFAVFGDLTESMLKRSMKVKDSGSLLPGHGGVLDRIDSLLLVGPVIFIYMQILKL
jgi:phosphatidate cytidylyltransferase